ncbi:MAG: mechanosensitive ion channel family protein [Solobacterium sp.]|nr:mechanosensitive ion channel family protein [Solobacterium sp.]
MNMESILDIGSTVFDGGLVFFLIHATVMLVFAHVLTKIAGKAANRAVRKENSRTTFSYIEKIVRAIVYIIAVLSILDKVKFLDGVGSTLLGATGIITVIVGLAAQETFGNFIAGFFLALYQPFQVGDVVSLPEKNVAGTVKEITFRHTVIKTLENFEIIIPNSVMNTAIIEDRQYGQDIYCKFITLAVSYDTDIPLMKKTILEVIAEQEKFIDIRTEEELNDDLVVIRIDDFLDSGLKVFFPVRARTLKDVFILASDVRIGVLEAFRNNGIEIPYNKIEIVNR